MPKIINFPTKIFVEVVAVAGIDGGSTEVRKVKAKRLNRLHYCVHSCESFFLLTYLNTIIYYGGDNNNNNLHKI